MVVSLPAEDTHMKWIFILMGLAAVACSGGAKDSVSLSARLGAGGGETLPAADGGVQAASGIELTRVRARMNAGAGPFHIFFFQTMAVMLKMVDLHGMHGAEH